MNNNERKLQDQIDRLAKQQKKQEELLRQTASELLDLRGAMADLQVTREKIKKSLAPKQP